MNLLETLLANNRKWAENTSTQYPGFFEQLARKQSPRYLWVGCADSRVPANQIIGLPPGEVFVHTNIANVVVHTDLNCLSVIQYAVEVLHVEHIIVTGHYGCGGITAALAAQEQKKRYGLIDNWLRHIRDVYRIYCKELQAIPDFETRCNRLCELNVIEQCRNIISTTIVQKAWDQKQTLHIHPWIYNLKNGLLCDLGDQDYHLRDEFIRETHPSISS